MLHEHDVISSMERVIDTLDGLWLNSPNEFVNIVAEALTFFRDYADGYHHQKEEQILFPRISRHPEFMIHELLDEFEQHHEDFRELTTEIEHAIQSQDYPGAYKYLTSYTQDLLDHIAAENDELFVLAESLLDEGELETVYFLFKDIDRDLGEDRKIELEQIPASLLNSISA